MEYRLSLYNEDVLIGHLKKGATVNQLLTTQKVGEARTFPSEKAAADFRDLIYLRHTYGEGIGWVCFPVTEEDHEKPWGATPQISVLRVSGLSLYLESEINGTSVTLTPVHARAQRILNIDIDKKIDDLYNAYELAFVKDDPAEVSA